MYVLPRPILCSNDLLSFLTLNQYHFYCFVDINHRTIALSEISTHKIPMESKLSENIELFHVITT